MAPPITRAVRFLTSFHSTLRTASPEAVAQRTIFSPDKFPQFLAVSCVLSAYAGYHTMEYIRNTHVSSYTVSRKMRRILV